ncbi:hypothetical protein JCM8547_005123 [Rhodosporidiobolus lusitaniae]
MPPSSSALPTSHPDPHPSHHPRTPPSDPGDSDLRLPPTLLAGAEDGTLYEGENPTVFADRLLHPPSSRPSLSTKRGSSWTQILTGSRTPSPAPGASQGEGEEDALLGEQGASASARAGKARGRDKGKRDRSESVHRRRGELPWWKRPSPVWFIPGTLAISLSMGMTIAPKLEIYTQLICRSMDPERSGVTAPPPILAKDPNASSLSSFSSQGRTVAFEWTPEGKGGEKAWEVREEDVDMDKEWTRQCHKSREVQSEVTRLALILSLLMGILSSLTTGFWGAWSDRRGRRPVLVLALLGTVLMDITFLLTVNFHQILSYYFLLLGPILDGLLGGYSTAQAATSAYLSDVTPSGSRARIFSLLGGLMFVGIGFGPLLGSFLITYTGSALTPFYASLALHAGYFLLALGVLPESLEKERMGETRVRYCAEKERRRNEIKLGGGGVVKYVVQTALGVFSFLEPVALLLPRQSRPRTEGGEEEEEEDPDARPNIDWGEGLEEYHHPEDVWVSEEGGKGAGGGGGRSGWSLTLIAAAWTSYMMLVAVMQTKLLYAAFTFSWGPSQNGYFLSFIGFLRVLTLVVVLPLFIKQVLGRREPPVPVWEKPGEVEGEADEEGEEREGRKEREEKRERWERERKWLKVVFDSHFDLRLALTSLSLDLLGFLLYTLAPLLSRSLHTSHLSLFLLAALLQSLGSGATPALQSLALAHASPRDAGRLFASLSVLQSLANQVVGPLVFSLTYMRTVGRWSEAIFALATGLSAVSCGALALVRLRRVFIDPEAGAKRSKTANGGGVETIKDGEEETGGGRRPAMPGRGRSETQRKVVRPSESGISLRTQGGGEEEE